MKTLIDCLKALCLVAAVFVMVEAGRALRELRDLSHSASAVIAEASGAAAELRKAATSVSEYARYQTDRLHDPRNEKALEAGIQALAVLNGTGRLINRQVIPRTMAVLDSLSNATASLDRAIQATDRSNPSPNPE